MDNTLLDYHCFGNVTDQIQQNSKIGGFWKSNITKFQQFLAFEKFPFHNKTFVSIQRWFPGWSGWSQAQAQNAAAGLPSSTSNESLSSQSDVSLVGHSEGQSELSQSSSTHTLVGLEEISDSQLLTEDEIGELVTYWLAGWSLDNSGWLAGLLITG